MNRERLKIIKVRKAVTRNRTTLSMVLSHRKGRGFCRLYRPFPGKLEFGVRWGPARGQMLQKHYQKCPCGFRRASRLEASIVNGGSDPGKKKGRKRSLPFDRLYLEESVLVGLPIELRSYHCSEQIL